MSHSELNVGKGALVPYSDTDAEQTDDCEEEICVGKRGYKKKKPLPKRLLTKKKRFTGVRQNRCATKKCGNDCMKNFTESDRISINEHFWGIGNKLRQKDWLLSCIRRKNIRRVRSTSPKKKFSYDYSINFNDKTIKVCQQFLLSTLSISQTLLISAKDNAEILIGNKERKERKEPHNKSDIAKVSILKAFIEKLPAVPSHYCRNKSNKLYISHEFRNVAGLYKCYVKHLKSIKQESAKLSLRVFRNIFNNEFHIGFHLPKKDKCVTCERYKNLDNEAKSNFRHTEEYRNHIQAKEKSKELFLEDQKKGKSNSEFLCASFDLQKVLNTPHGRSVNLFYSRKYAYYNESVYENGTKNGYCFLWGESDGKRGCNEISTIIFQYLTLLDERKTHESISLYCDSCAGQNRNRAMLAALAFFLEKSVFVKNIKITYLLPGHTMMPVDSIHSTIESFIRERTVWAPTEWYTMIGSARTNPSSYTCIAMHHSHFKDWKSFASAMFPPTFRINFQKLRSASFEKNSSIIKLKYGYFECSETKEYDVKSTPQSRRNSSLLNNGPLPLYNRELSISLAKYKNLKDLCDKNIIPQKFQKEYLNLKSDEDIRDVLPETDEEDNVK